MLAAPVGVDRGVEADVGAVIAGDDLAGALDVELGGQLRWFGIVKGPAVVELFARLALIAAGGVRARATASDGEGGGHAVTLAPEQNITRTNWALSPLGPHLQVRLGRHQSQARGDRYQLAAGLKLLLAKPL